MLVGTGMYRIDRASIPAKDEIRTIAHALLIKPSCLTVIIKTDSMSG